MMAVALILGAIVGSGRAAADPVDDSYVESDDDDQTYVLYEFLTGIRDMIVKYGYATDVTIRYITEREDAVAGTTPSGEVVFEERLAENPALWEHVAAVNLQAGYWPQTSCTPARMIALHEFGHVIDVHSPGDAEVAVSRKYSGVKLFGVLPGYSLNPDGTAEPGEALANAFAAVECGAGNATERDLHRILLESR